MFEGFYRIERNRKHVGFAVQRLRQDGDQRILTSYYRFKRPDETEVFESFKTVFTRANGDPVSSEHHGDKTGLALPELGASFTVGPRSSRLWDTRNHANAATSLTNVKMLSSTLFLIRRSAQALTQPNI